MDVLLSSPVVQYYYLYTHCLVADMEELAPVDPDFSKTSVVDVDTE